MRVAIFSAHGFERGTLTAAAEREGHELTFFEAALGERTAVLGAGFPAVSIFVTDTADGPTLERLAAGGTRMLALRSAGFNNVDLAAAARLGVTVARVPAYSPYSVAEHTAALVLTVNRKLHRAISRVREHNFSLEGLVGFDLHGKTVGVIGTGRIGAVFCRIMAGFGCRVLVHDPAENPEVTALGARYVPLEELYRQSDIVSLHCPLTPATKHLINAASLAMMKPGVMLINTGRGALVDTRALIAGLKSGRIGALGLDVYEEEGDVFFKDLSGEVLQDDVLARLLTFPNVVVTAHQAFFTREALGNIADTTMRNVSGFERGAVEPANLVRLEAHVAPQKK